MFHEPHSFFLKRKGREIFVATLFLALFACTGQKEEAGATPPARWYKGNTHSHTVICGHADSSPEAVARWYHDRGYNFLILSEHNHFINPDSVTLPDNKREDFILIPGEEVTGHQHIHTTGMNTGHFVPATASEENQASQSAPDVLQMHVDSIRQAGGAPILNHPNYLSGIHAHELLGVKRLHMFELYNGHPDVHNWGNELHAATEQKWDSMLTAGMLVYGVSSDDAHKFQEWSPRMSNPGRGWVMVKSEALTPDAITHAMEHGDFYATNGIILSAIVHKENSYEVRIDSALTQRELRSPYVIGKREQEGPEGYLIEFIGPQGKVLQSTQGIQATYKTDAPSAYLRCRLSYRRKGVGGGYERFFAWTQPRFFDGRAEEQQ